ncbi:MAG: tetratricopeptide repeat protein [Dehalococcoidia bacterium]
MGNSRSDEAINLAVQGRWEEAVAVNKEILELAPNDIEALNRLGKALSELGRYSQAREAYQKVLEIDHHNRIASKNLQRLSLLKDGERAGREPQGIDSRFFIEETTKARRVNLHKLGSEEVLGRIAPGGAVYLRVNNGKLHVVSDKGDYVGEVEPKIGARLARLMEGGNEYKAAIVSLKQQEVKVIIRETYQHPSQAGHPSFPPPKTVEEIRPYLKDSMVKREIDEEPIEEIEATEEWEPEEDLPAEDDVSIEGEDSSEKDDLDKVV